MNTTSATYLPSTESIQCYTPNHIDTMTTLQLFGFLISLAGFQLYNNLKSDQAYLVKIWHSVRGVECMDEGSPLVGSHDECIKLDKCGKGLKATEEQSAVCHVTQVRKTSKIDV